MRSSLLFTHPLTLQSLSNLHLIFGVTCGKDFDTGLILSGYLRFDSFITDLSIYHCWGTTLCWRRLSTNVAHFSEALPEQPYR